MAELQRLVVYGDTREQVMPLCTKVNACLRGAGCATEATWTMATQETRANVGVDRLPAILLVRHWPDDVDVVWRGEEPPEKVLRRCAALLYEAEAPLRAEMEALRGSIEESRRLAPRTLEEAVSRMLAEMSHEDKETVRSTPQCDLIQLHHAWGIGIRNAWLYGNSELMEDCGARHDPDDASMKIIEAVWKRLTGD